MAGYRFFSIGADDRIFHAAEADCADDGEACAEARLRAEGWDIEIWQGKRFVARVPATRRDDV